MTDNFDNSDNEGLLKIDEVPVLGTPVEPSVYDFAIDSVFGFFSKINNFLKEHDPIPAFLPGVDAQARAANYIPPPTFNSLNGFNTFDSGPSTRANNDNFRSTQRNTYGDSYSNYNSYNNFPSPSLSHQAPYWTEHTQTPQPGFKYDPFPPPPPSVQYNNDAYLGTGYKPIDLGSIFKASELDRRDLESKIFASGHSYTDLYTLKQEVNRVRYRWELNDLERRLGDLNKYQSADIPKHSQPNNLHVTLNDLDKGFERSKQEYEKEKEREKESDERFRRLREEQWFFTRQEQAKHAAVDSKKEGSEYWHWFSHAKEIELLRARIALARFYADMQSRNIPIKGRHEREQHQYIRNILSIPIQSIIDILESGVAEDALMSLDGTPRPAAAGGGASGGGDDGDGGNYDENVRREKLLLDTIKALDIQDHEGGEHNGHTIEKHIGKTKEWLENRAKNQNINGATSFTDLNTANRYIRETLASNINNIMGWLSKPGDPAKPFTAEFKSAGYGFNKNRQYFDSIRKVKIVLQRTSDFNFKIITAYPDIK